MVSDFLLNIHLYTHGLMQLSACIGEAYFPVDDGSYRDSQLVKVQIMSDCRMLSPKGDISIPLSTHWGWGITGRRRGGKIIGQRLEKTVANWFFKADARNYCTCGYLHRLEPINFSTWKKKRAHKAMALPEWYWQLMVGRGRDTTLILILFWIWELFSPWGWMSLVYIGLSKKQFLIPTK